MKKSYRVIKSARITGIPFLPPSIINLTPSVAKIHLKKGEIIPYIKVKK